MLNYVSCVGPPGSPGSTTARTQPSISRADPDLPPVQHIPVIINNRPPKSVYHLLSGLFVCLRGGSIQTNREDRLRRTVTYLLTIIVLLSKSKKLDQGLSLFEKSQAAEP